MTCIVYKRVQINKLNLKIFEWRSLITKQSNVQCFSRKKIVTNKIVQLCTNPMVFYLFVYNYKEHIEQFWWNSAFIFKKIKSINYFQFVVLYQDDVNCWHKLTGCRLTSFYSNWIKKQKIISLINFYIFDCVYTKTSQLLILLRMSWKWHT